MRTSRRYAQYLTVWSRRTAAGRYGEVVPSFNSTPFTLGAKRVADTEAYSAENEGVDNAVSARFIVNANAAVRVGDGVAIGAGESPRYLCVAREQWFDHAEIELEALS